MRRRDQAGRPRPRPPGDWAGALLGFGLAYIFVGLRHGVWAHAASPSWRRARRDQSQWEREPAAAAVPRSEVNEVTVPGLVTATAPSLAEPQRAEGTRWGNVAGTLTAVLGGAGIFAGGAMRVPYEDYYRALGTSLDQVGLGVPRTLTLVTLGVSTLVGLALSASLPPILLGCRHDAGVRRNALGGLSFLAALVGLEEFLHRQPWYAVWAGVVVTGLALAASLLGAHRFGSLQGTVLRLLRFTAVAVLASGCVVFFGAERGAPAAAARLARGVTGNTSMADAFLDVDPQPFCVRDLGGSTLPEVPVAEILLGTKDGFHVLLQPDRSHPRVRLVPTGAAVLIRGRFAPGTRIPTC